MDHATIRFYCQSCKSGIETSIAEKGQIIKCPTCRSQNTVPEQSPLDVTGKLALLNAIGYLSPFLPMGRVSALQFWLRVAPIIAFILWCQEGRIGLKIPDALYCFVVIGVIVLWWYMFMNYIKRWHDLGKSGWNILWGFVPIVGWAYVIINFFTPGEDGANKYGGDPRMRGKVWGVANEGDLERIREIIQAFPDAVSKCDRRYGGTPLHWATKSNQIEIMEFLLNKGADINAKELDGSTPLHEAVYNRHKQAVILLLARGADIDAEDSRGKKPLDLTESRGKEEISESNREQIANLLRHNQSNSLQPQTN